ncbi:MAG: cupin, partial [Candidatus Omnitrophota bacterium]
MKVTVQKLSQEEIKAKKIPSWPIWEKEVSRFNWHYDQTEECYLLQGKV